MINFRWIKTILLFLTPVLLMAQENNTDSLEIQDREIFKQNDIIMLSKCTKEGIKFRWAPSNVSTWKMGIKHGYTFERMSVDTNVYLPVGKGLFKPMPEAEWPKVEADTEINYMHAAAKCMFEKSETQGFVNNANDLSNRHAFHLMIADFDKEAAEASGLSYFEKDTSDTSFGQYRIYTFNPETNECSDTFHFIAAYYGLDVIRSPELQLDEQDGAIQLTWNGGGQVESDQSKLTAFHIERSTDGKIFTRLNQQPFMNGITDLQSDRRYTTYVDSVENGIKYQYRVIGMDAFADQTEPSNVVEGMGIDLTPPDAPFGLKADVIDNSQVQLNWEWQDTSQYGDLDGFNVYFGTDREKPFKKINEKLLSKKSRSYLDETPGVMGFNFYYIEAVDKSANGAKSGATLGHIVDMYPPQAPRNLEATIDSNGMVLITWDKPEDNDIRGYELFFSNSEDYDFTKKPVPIIQNEFFVDSTTLRTLTKTLYYKVVATDYSFNRSDMSEQVLVIRPDIIPPAPSLFVDYYVTVEGIEIKWEKSISTDVTSVILERREAGKDWIQLDEFDSNNNLFVDKNVVAGVLYEYNLITIDESDNRSMPEKTLVLEARHSFFLDDISDVKAELKGQEINLSWDYEKIEDHRFIVYMADKDGDMITYKKLEGQNSISVPYEEEKGNYSFAVKVKGPDGRTSKMSDVVSVK